MDMTPIPDSQKCHYCNNYGYTSKLNKDMILIKLCVDHLASLEK